jgi:hypothetical protein
MIPELNKISKKILPKNNKKIIISSEKYSYNHFFDILKKNKKEIVKKNIIKDFFSLI